MSNLRQDSQKSVGMAGIQGDYLDTLNSSLEFLKIIDENPLNEINLLHDYLKSVSWLLFQYCLLKNTRLFVKILINIFEFLISNPHHYDAELSKKLRKSFLLLKLYYRSKYQYTPESIKVTHDSIEIIKDYVR